MCGISAYYGDNNCEEILLSFLEKLEYRGYDSSGIAVKSKNKIYLTKDACKISELKNLINTLQEDKSDIYEMLLKKYKSIKSKIVKEIAKNETTFVK